MPLRPFPFSLNLGTDICHIPRFSKYLLYPQPSHSKASGTSGTGTGTGTSSTSASLFHLFDKLLLPAEQRIFWKRFGPLESLGSSQGKRQGAICWIAGRWAAKEAIIKAYTPTRRILLRDIELRALSSGQPYGIVFDRTFKASKAEDMYSAWKLNSDITGDSLRDGEGVEMREGGAETREGNTGIEDDELNTLLKAKESNEDITEEEDIDGQVVRVSISHDGEYCTAVALAPVEVKVPELGL